VTGSRPHVAALAAALRQLLQPPELRISAPDPAAVLPLLEALGREPRSPGAEEPRARLLAEMATGLWRLRGRMVDAGTGEPHPEMRRAFRHLQAVWDALARAGVEVQEHAGRPFDPGQSLRVLAFQPTAGLPRETVLETVKPCVYLDGQRIQVGEVIVGTPEGASSGKGE
jgi:hypothetical protein